MSVHHTCVDNFLFIDKFVFMHHSLSIDQKHRAQIEFEIAYYKDLIQELNVDIFFRNLSS